MNKWDLIKWKASALQTTQSLDKVGAYKMENIFINFTSGRKLIPKIYKEQQKSGHHGNK